MLDRRADAKAQALPVLRQLGEVGCDKALASLWINPRAFDAVLQAQAAELGETPEGKSLRSFLTYWKALDGVSLSVLVEKNPEVVLSLHARSDRLPAAARKLVAGSAKPSEAWDRLPADSVVAVAGRTDFEALLETLEELLPEEAEEGLTEFLQNALGLPLSKELLQALASQIGPDWGFAVAAPANKEEFPHVLFALRQRGGPGGPDLTQSLHLLAKVAIKEHNRKNKEQIKLEVMKQDGVDVRYLVNNAKFPKGFQPAFAARDGYLLLGSSPAALHRFGQAGPPPPPGAATPLARISFKQLSTLLKDRRDKVVDFLGKKRQLTPQAAGKHFENLTWALDLFDTAELVQHTDGERVAWVFRLRTAEPLK
jgi:hypothetical protein